MQDRKLWDTPIGGNQRKLLYERGHGTKKKGRSVNNSNRETRDVAYRSRSRFVIGQHIRGNKSGKRKESTKGASPS